MDREGYTGEGLAGYSGGLCVVNDGSGKFQVSDQGNQGGSGEWETPGRGSGLGVRGDMLSLNSRWMALGRDQKDQGTA